MLIRLFQHATTGRVAAGLGRLFLRICVSFNFSSRAKKLVNGIGRPVAGPMASSVLGAATDGLIAWCNITAGNARLTGITCR